MTEPSNKQAETMQAYEERIKAFESKLQDVESAIEASSTDE